MAGGGWRFEGSGEPEVEVKLSLAGLKGGSFRVVSLECGAPVNNLQVIRYGGVGDLEKNAVTVKLKPWDIRWIEIE